MPVDATGNQKINSSELAVVQQSTDGGTTELHLRYVRLKTSPCYDNIASPEKASVLLEMRLTTMPKDGWHIRT